MSSDIALGRLLDYYQHTAAQAQERLARQTRSGPVPCTSTPGAVPALNDAGKALAWARAERGNLFACLAYVTEAGQHARVVAFTAALAEPLRLDGPWAEAIRAHATALQSAQYLGDRLGEADALSDLGNARRVTGDYPGAVGDLEQALAIYRALGDGSGEAEALNETGTLHRLSSTCFAADASNCF
jgi:tetratricopeptide (TPR) repeat protein